MFKKNVPRTLNVADKMKFAREANGSNKMRLAYAATAAVGTFATMAPIVFAGGGIDDTANAMVAQLIGIICTIFMYIGILLAVWAVGSLVLAFKNEDADSKSRAMMLLIVSIVLICLRPVVRLLLQVSGTGITI